MDWDQFTQSLLGDGASLAGYATAAGSSAIVGDITGNQNAANQLLSKLTGVNVAGGSVVTLLIIGLVFYLIVKEA